MTPKFKLLGKSFQIPGRGLVVIGELLEACESTALSELKGQPLDWEGNVWEITGVESYATMHQPKGRTLGLAIKPWFEP